MLEKVVLLSSLAVLIAGMFSPAAHAVNKEYPIHPIAFTQVHFGDFFWTPRLETNRMVTLPYDFKKCEETGRINNFAIAGGLMEGSFEGIRFNDSDVFKIVEGAAYCLSLKPDPELDAYLDDLIAKFAAAQEDDGYLYTIRTIYGDNMPPREAQERWGDLQDGHELYNVGHMYEAAVAHYQATGKRNFLDVALKNADLIYDVFGPKKRIAAPGHEEIEIGLTKLYRISGKEKYLTLAKRFIDARGDKEHRTLYGDRYQDHLPVLQQKEAVGHAVRAGYLYSGMADVAALTGNEDYIQAITTIWKDAVYKKLYLTGGIGAIHHHERFGEAYELPNATAYNETCAAIANAMWNHRLFLLSGEAKYLDVLERVLYNGFLSGVSFGGDTFFYPNPLSSDGKYAFNHGSTERKPWFNCSCCPSNVVRFMPSLPGYVYGQKDDTIYVNLFIAGKADLSLNDVPVQIQQQTRYPWDGDITIRVSPKQEQEFTLNVRVPGWVLGKPLPSDLYTYLDDTPGTVRFTCNGEVITPEIENGFACIQRTWKAGDTVQCTFPMPIRRVVCNENVAANRGRIALERGPIVYCAEWPDNQGHVANLVLPDTAKLTTQWRKDLLHGVMTIEGTALALHREKTDEELLTQEQPFLAIPYYAWAHRGAGEMAVWLARETGVATPLLPPTLASRSTITTSHTGYNDVTSALNDQLEPASSNDQSIPRFTWWNHKGSIEWVQYTFPESVSVSEVSVYWFDDAPHGECRIPKTWRLRWRDGERWRTVKTKTPRATDKDRWITLPFDTVQTDALRLEAKLQDSFSGGILEWKVK